MPGTWRLVNGPPRVQPDGNRFLIHPAPRALRWDRFCVTVWKQSAGTLIEVEQRIHRLAAAVYGLLIGLYVADWVLFLPPELGAEIRTGDPAHASVALVEVLGLVYVVLRLLSLWARSVQQGQFTYWLQVTAGAE